VLKIRILPIFKLLRYRKTSHILFFIIVKKLLIYKLVYFMLYNTSYVITL
jgi:hypothetical protein